MPPLLLLFQATPEDKLAEIFKYKEAGNAFYREKLYSKAAGQYHRAALYVKAVETDAKGVEGILPMMPDGPGNGIKDKGRTRFTILKQSPILCDHN
jgi:hypothetical protein